MLGGFSALHVGLRAAPLPSLGSRVLTSVGNFPVSYDQSRLEGTGAQL